MHRVFTLLCVLPLVVSLVQGAETVIDLTCANSDDFKTAAEGLNCGETLRVRDSATCNNSTKIVLAHQCSAILSVIITNYPGESPLIDQTASQNTINIINSQYLTINGLEITSTGGGSGITLEHAGNANITISNNVIHNVGVGIESPAASADHLTIAGNEIYDTNYTGEGIYLGNHTFCDTTVGAVSNSTISNNYIHDLGGADGDGIELKCGSYGNTIADNVLDATGPYPAIFVYGNAHQEADNIIERNLVMNCQGGSSGEGILASADAIVRNNVVLNCDSGGIQSYHVNPSVIGGAKFYNNTVYNTSAGANCLYIHNAHTASTVFANNALYCPNGNAVFDGAFNSLITFRDNYVSGSFSGGSSIDNVEFFDGGVAADAFINPGVPPGAADFYLRAGSVLINNANATDAPADDFNTTIRTATDDVGAYESETSSTNPGWAIGSGFKANDPPTVDPPAAPGNLQVQ